MGFWCGVNPCACSYRFNGYGGIIQGGKRKSCQNVEVGIKELLGVKIKQ
jgi:hypothetical protein